MYISSIHIENYRCFKDITIEFHPGVNVIIGENNAGKTALLRALGLVFDRRGRTPSLYDFCKLNVDESVAPSITITIVLRSDANDGIEDRALVATWLTKLTEPWEAQLTYQYFLPDKPVAQFAKERERLSEEDYWMTVERYLPKYITRIYGGNPNSQLRAEPDALNKFAYQFLDAIRDVESELFSGSNPLLKSMLLQVLDEDLEEHEDDEEQQRVRDERSRAFRESTGLPLKQLINKRIDQNKLFSLVTETGAADGGKPLLEGQLEESDFLAAIRLFIERKKLRLPAIHNGLGYNNLIYISLILASLDFRTSRARFDENAVIFPLLVIEEPEAHLHPVLQYKLLKYIKRRLKRNKSRQIFLTTHSTHITAASGLDAIICMSLSTRTNEVRVSYPGRSFEDDESKKYVERYLDATKSNMLFSKGIIFVEGLAEQLIIPRLADYIEGVNASLEEHHVTIIPVGGSTFKHFLPIFGAGVADKKKEKALVRRVACIVDGDPMRRKRLHGQRRKKCWPFQLGIDSDNYDYFTKSGVVENLEDLCNEASNIRIFCADKTFEYDLAINEENWQLLLDCLRVNDNSGVREDHTEALEQYVKNPAVVPNVLRDLIENNDADAWAALNEINDWSRAVALFASSYLLAVSGAKGAHALELAHHLQENLGLDDDRLPFEVPIYIEDAILWACRQEV